MAKILTFVQEDNGEFYAVNPDFISAVKSIWSDDGGWQKEASKLVVEHAGFTEDVVVEGSPEKVVAFINYATSDMVDDDGEDDE